MKYILVFSLYVFMSAYGLYKIKASDNYIEPQFLIGFTLYFAGFLVWFYILRITPLSVAFPVAAGSLIIATTLLGITLLGEAMTVYKIAGAIAIIIGIVLMSVGEQLNR